LNSVLFSFEKVDRWNSIRTSAIQSIMLVWFKAGSCNVLRGEGL
jgi:hypothetical protein